MLNTFAFGTSRLVLPLRVRAPQLARRFLNSTTAGSSPFPSLTIRGHELIPRGSFAEAQAQFLQPDDDTITELDRLLAEHNVGVVAHFYMDPELQGVLQAAKWPHIFIADSLAMGDAALKMARSGVKAITVLGVDFMSENVQATLRHEGFDTPVYRLSEKHIGCSLAESAESLAYAAFLNKASRTPNSLHVVYINTSLQTKANAQATVPTITCTSSNVVSTILQAAAQIPDVHLWFGPDTCMGENLVQTFEQMADSLSDEQIQALHPAHTRSTVRDLLNRFNYFKQGICTVHHMFDDQVTEQISKHHSHDFLTAHLEVPGPMFRESLKAEEQGRGRVGSTSDILNFITSKVTQAVNDPASSSSSAPCRLPFVLGTEAGMITGIVNQVQHILRETGSSNIEADIIFPVSSAAIAQAPESGLGIVPGVASGEGCSSAGGCATCPFMKMNSLDSLLDVVTRIGAEEEKSSDLSLQLAKHLVQARHLEAGQSTQLGVTPIMSMRNFQQTGRFDDDLIMDVMNRGKKESAP